MAATIIQFPQTHSNAYYNLKSILEIAASNEAIAEYAEIAQAIDEKGGFRPGETEEIAEIIRAKRIENAAPVQKPALQPTKPGLYCYTPEMGETKPECEIEALRSYYGNHYTIYTTLELKGRGIKTDGTKAPDGRNRYVVTNRAFDMLQEKYTISQELLLD